MQSDIERIVYRHWGKGGHYYFRVLAGCLVNNSLTSSQTLQRNFMLLQSCPPEGCGRSKSLLIWQPSSTSVADIPFVGILSLLSLITRMVLVRVHYSRFRLKQTIFIVLSCQRLTQTLLDSFKAFQTLTGV